MGFVVGQVPSPLSHPSVAACRGPLYMARRFVVFDQLQAVVQFGDIFPLLSPLFFPFDQVLQCRYRVALGDHPAFDYLTDGIFFQATGSASRLRRVTLFLSCCGWFVRRIRFVRRCGFPPLPSGWFPVCPFVFPLQLFNGQTVFRGVRRARAPYPLYTDASFSGWGFAWHTAVILGAWPVEW
eukprot:SAG11_NODE_2505_length_3274_cov_9.450882_4_plen_182_part_00